MKVLFITTKSPLPINDGHSLRSFNLLKAVAEQHDVTLLSFVKFPVEYDNKIELEKYCNSVKQYSVPDNCSRLRSALSACLNLAENQPYVVTKYNQQCMREEIRRLLRDEKFDLVHLDMLPLGSFLNEINIPVILNAHNVESALLKRRCESISNPIVKWYFTEQQRRLENFEKNTVRKVSYVIACSEEDRVILQSMAPTQNTSVVPNGVDTDFYQLHGATTENKNNLVFVGGMNWFPNRDAVEWFDDAILPELIRLTPDVSLDVIGKTADGMAIQHGQLITMHGFVKDTRPYIEKSSVVIVPIRIGGGTRLKVLEAMSMGRALVSTTVGVEGIKVTDRQHVLIADTPQEFALAIAELQQNAELRTKLGNAARELVFNNYRWDMIGNRLLEVYKDVREKTA